MSADKSKIKKKSIDTIEVEKFKELAKKKTTVEDILNIFWKDPDCNLNYYYLFTEIASTIRSRIVKFCDYYEFFFADNNMQFFRAMKIKDLPKDIDEIRRKKLYEEIIESESEENFNRNFLIALKKFLLLGSIPELERLPNLKDQIFNVYLANDIPDLNRKNWVHKDFDEIDKLKCVIEMNNSVDKIPDVTYLIPIISCESTYYKLDNGEFRVIISNRHFRVGILLNNELTFFDVNEYIHTKYPDRSDVKTEYIRRTQRNNLIINNFFTFVKHYKFVNSCERLPKMVHDTLSDDTSDKIILVINNLFESGVTDRTVYLRKGLVNIDVSLSELRRIGYCNLLSCLFVYYYFRFNTKTCEDFSNKLYSLFMKVSDTVSLSYFMLTKLAIFSFNLRKLHRSR